MNDGAQFIVLGVNPNSHRQIWKPSQGSLYPPPSGGTEVFSTNETVEKVQVFRFWEIRMWYNQLLKSARIRTLGVFDRLNSV
ncbi:MAG: hypothetical protein ACFFCW_38960 [Candidatus Hodarchaeota archaeon]